MKKMHLAILVSLPVVLSLPKHRSTAHSLNKSNRTDKSICPETYRLLGETEANPYAVQELKDLLGGEHQAEIPVSHYQGDKSIRKFTHEIPNQKEGYYLIHQ